MRVGYSRRSASVHHVTVVTDLTMVGYCVGMYGCVYGNMDARPLEYA